VPTEILVDGDPRLRERSAPVESIDLAVGEDVARLCAALTDVRTRLGFGRALAAPQIGVLRRIVAVDLGAGPFVLINPAIAWASDETFEVWDDCFSVPDRIVRVRRHASITVEYVDERMRPRRWSRLPPELAELIQHELDHLDGVLMIDRAAGDDAIQPASRRAELVDAARPGHRLSLASIARAATSIDPVFLRSPQYVCEPLAHDLGCRLTLKIETANPIRCFKGRGADHFVAQLVARGERGPVVCASAGNFGQAMAYAGREHGLDVAVFAAETASPLKLDRMRALGAEVHVIGADFEAAKEAARAFAADSGARFVEDGREPAIAEGAGSIAIELCARGDAFDAIVVPVGDGALIGGVARWIKAASPATRVIGVCARGAPAMHDAFRRGPGAPVVPSDAVATISDGIAVRAPIPQAVADLFGLVDDMVLVDDEATIVAMQLLHARAGLVVEPAGAVGVAAILAARDDYADKDVATIVTGGNVTDDQLRAWRIV
jgi:peptide deformylase